MASYCSQTQQILKLNVSIVQTLGYAVWTPFWDGPLQLSKWKKKLLYIIATMSCHCLGKLECVSQNLLFPFVDWNPWMVNCVLVSQSFKLFEWSMTGQLLYLWIVTSSVLCMSKGQTRTVAPSISASLPAASLLSAESNQTCSKQASTTIDGATVRVWPNKEGPMREKWQLATSD